MDTQRRRERRRRELVPKSPNDRRPVRFQYRHNGRGSNGDAERLSFHRSQVRWVRASRIRESREKSSTRNRQRQRVPMRGTPTVTTAYCLSGVMADGSGVRPGSIAHNGYSLGTRVTVSASPTGARRFVVRDRIGWGTELDFWVSSCAAARAWGRRVVLVRQGWKRPRLVGRSRIVGKGLGHGDR
jgi:3D (Asp-Asp-Asp) domain-containing protein